MPNRMKLYCLCLIVFSLNIACFRHEAVEIGLTLNMVVKNGSEDTANVKLRYYKFFDHWEDDYTHTDSLIINPKSQKEISIEYRIYDCDNVNLGISCIDSVSILGAEQCYTVNDSHKKVYNLDYKEFTIKTNNRYKVSLSPENCSNGFVNIGNIIIPENDIIIFIDDTLALPYSSN